MSDQNIKTFAVIDLETNGLPSEQFNTCSITEISLYAFSAKCLKDRDSNQILKNVTEGFDGVDSLPPELPRVLHKMTLMINPRSMIKPQAEQTTGLSNEMLEKESPFDENTASCLNLFLERLEQPICMVAHNGWTFDYPIIRYVYEKLKMQLPSFIYCVDSLNAFREFDEKSEEIQKILETDGKEIKVSEKPEEMQKILDTNELEIKGDEKSEEIQKILETDEIEIKEIELSTRNQRLDSLKTCDPLEQNSKINWKLHNETTPQRKRKLLTNYDNLISETLVKKRFVSLSVRRSLFADDFKPKTKYPPKGVYKLGSIYKRCFKQEPINLHRAESDVEILTKLVLHYGLNFLAYAEERKQPFTKVPKLGSSGQ